MDVRIGMGCTAPLDFPGPGSRETVGNGWTPEVRSLPVAQVRRMGWKPVAARACIEGCG